MKIAQALDVIKGCIPYYEAFKHLADACEAVVDLEKTEERLRGQVDDHKRELGHFERAIEDARQRLDKDVTREKELRFAALQAEFEGQRKNLQSHLDRLVQKCDELQVKYEGLLRAEEAKKFGSESKVAEAR